MKTKEAVFNDKAIQSMASYNLEGFKRSYPTLYDKVIIPSMQEYADLSCAELQSDLKEKDWVIESLVKENKAFEKSNKDLMRENHVLHEQSVLRYDEIKELKSEIETYKKAGEILSTTNKKLEADCRKHEAENAELRSEQKKLKIIFEGIEKYGNGYASYHAKNFLEAINQPEKLK